MLHRAPSILSVADCNVRSPEELHQQFLLLYDEDRIVINLTGIDALDADFFSELAQLRLHRRTKGLLLGRLVVDSYYVRKALSAVGFERHWPTFTTLQEALASFDGPVFYA